MPRRICIELGMRRRAPTSALIVGNSRSSNPLATRSLESSHLHAAIRRDGRVANAKRPGIAAGPFLLLCSEWLDLEVHTTHAAHAAATRSHAGAGARVLLRHFGHHGFGCD